MAVFPAQVLTGPATRSNYYTALLLRPCAALVTNEFALDIGRSFHPREIVGLENSCQCELLNKFHRVPSQRCLWQTLWCRVVLSCWFSIFLEPDSRDRDMSCEVKRIQQNSAQATVDQATSALKQAKSEYISCLGPQEAGAVAFQDSQPAMDAAQKEAETLRFLQTFVLKQLAREASAEQTMDVLSAAARDEETKLREEIEQVKSEIRTERRRFLDAQPSVSPKVNGLYFTTEPDNQVLIAFLACFCSFLLFVGLMVIMNKFPGGFLLSMSSGERIKIVVAGWVAVLIVTYIFFFTFT